MKIATFNNTVVGMVSAYAEVLAEQAQMIDQLQEALRQAAKNKQPPVESNPSQYQALTQAAKTVILAVHSIDLSKIDNSEMYNINTLLASIDALSKTLEGQK